MMKERRAQMIRVNIKTRFILIVSFLVALLAIGIKCSANSATLELLVFFGSMFIGQWLMSTFVFEPFDFIMREVSKFSLNNIDFCIPNKTFDKSNELSDELNRVLGAVYVSDAFKSAQLLILAANFYTPKMIRNVTSIIEQNHIENENDLNASVGSIKREIVSGASSIVFRVTTMIPKWMYDMAMQLNDDLLLGLLEDITNTIKTESNIEARTRCVQTSCKFYLNSFTEQILARTSEILKQHGKS